MTTPKMSQSHSVCKVPLKPSYHVILKYPGEAGAVTPILRVKKQSPKAEKE